MEQFFQWDERQLAVGELSTFYLENPWDKHNLEYFKTNPTRNLLILWKKIHCLAMEAQSVAGDAFSILLPENSYKITWREFMTWRLNNCKENHSHSSPAGYRGQPKPNSNPNAQHMTIYKESIKREVSQYPILKDEKYFEAFKRNLLVTATTHSCDEVLDEHYTPGHDADSQELFQQKEYFMHNAFNKVLQSDMGKTIVRKQAPTLDHSQYVGNLSPICPHHPKVSMKDVDYMPMCLQPSMADPGRELQNNLFSTSMRSSGN